MLRELPRHIGGVSTCWKLQRDAACKTLGCVMRSPQCPGSLTGGPTDPPDLSFLACRELYSFTHLQLRGVQDRVRGLRGPVSVSLLLDEASGELFLRVANVPSRRHFLVPYPWHCLPCRGPADSRETAS